ncbi:tyrosyl-tRNA synthetase [Cotonvirus japonicus]|uniref:tyrosine--tRNA ligase n=1 Tax=Cotonvirus japonicus TaxID=2811091 RepID=A0ABM7NRY8_9VIRU|nr:tyrosyl-tRNA synthetase [Cotonvirus japonicus]BCS82857.1 tyrosyl-tRNA synthetase [Cotonvirus japonicus]
MDNFTRFCAELSQNRDINVINISENEIIFEFVDKSLYFTNKFEEDRIIDITFIDNQKYLCVTREDVDSNFIPDSTYVIKCHDSYVETFDVDVKKRVDQLVAISEECDDRDRLRDLIISGKKFVAYNGFEPSGRIHIAQAVITVLNTNTIIENGGRMIIYIADWFAQLNHKLGGDLEKIQNVGRYFIEVFKACGIDTSNTEFIWASEFFAKNPSRYFQRMMDVSINATLARTKRCCQIMGRAEGDNLSSSQIIYPCMQTADIFELVEGGVDICQLGVDQRKVNMFALDYANSQKLKLPVILSHHMIMGLRGPKHKMSKSDPLNAIFMEDTTQEIHDKISKAFCPDTHLDNPIFEYIKYILLRWFGNLTLCDNFYTNIDFIIQDFPHFDKKRLKTDVANYIDRIIKPVRDHFAQDELKDLYDKVIN